MIEVNNEKFTKVKIVKFVAITSGIFTIIFGLSEVVFRIIFGFISGSSINTSNSSSIGIIGGADGPTAIFISSSVPPVFKYLLTALFFIITIVSIYILRKNKTEKQ